MRADCGFFQGYVKVRITILGCPIDALTLRETIAEIKKAIANKIQMHHCVVNAVKLVNMQEDEELFESVASADLINADGAGVTLLAKMLRTPFPERVAGIDLMQALVRHAPHHGWKCYFLGARENIVTEVVRRYGEKYGGSIIAGYRNGYFSSADEDAIVEDISSSGANILFVAISSPKKEIFLHRHREKLNGVNFIMGVGGSFDVVAGKVKRAPLWMQRLGLEWFGRFIQEPNRVRVFFLPFLKFLYYSLREIAKSFRGGTIARP